MKVYDLEEERTKRRLRSLLEKLDQMTDEVAHSYSETERLGYERFKRLVSLLDKKNASSKDTK
jgi:hypothetical protein